MAARSPATWDDRCGTIPLAALLTGVGLAWLMAGSGRGHGKGDDWDSEDQRYPRGPDPDLRTFGVSGGQTGDAWAGSGGL